MSQITVSCPQGHRLRGKSEMVGRRVKCPTCASVFVFSPPAAEVSDSSVLQILGAASALPPPPEMPVATTRPCPRCEQTIAVSANVCQHCNSYVGELPFYMQQLVDRPRRAEH